MRALAVTAPGALVLGRAPGWRRQRWLVRAYFALLFVVFTCVFPYSVKINNPNENVRVYMTMAIVDDGTFQIDDVISRAPIASVEDVAVSPDPVTSLPRRFSVKGPGTGYLGVPVYWLFEKLAPHFGHDPPTLTSAFEEKLWWFRAATLVLRIFVVELPCFLFLVWLERWLRGVSADTVLRLSAVTAAAIGSNYVAYSMMYVSHALFAACAFASFGLITRERMLYREAKRRRLSRALLAGVFAGFVSLLDYQGFVISAGLALYALTAFWRPTRLALFGLGAALNAAALMYYQWKCYGDPLTPGHKLVPGWSEMHKQGFFGLTEPSLEVLSALSFSRAFGFFGTSPFMVLGLLALPFGAVLGYGPRRERGPRRVATIAWMLMMLVLWVAISSALNWRGGWTIGPRFFGCAPPFFAFGALAALEHVARKGWLARALARALAGGLALASVLTIGVVSILYNSMPEEVTRPLAQIAIPLARAGFVPHHAGELLGWMSPAGWYIVLGCMLLAAAVSMLAPTRKERFASFALRLVLAPLVFAVAMLPAFSAETPEETAEAQKHGTEEGARRFLTAAWEPEDRDFVATARVDAERRGWNQPCLWFKVADLERLVGRDFEAARDEGRAGRPREACP